MKKKSKSKMKVIMKTKTKKEKFFIDKNAVVSPKAKIGSNTKIWSFAQIREKAKIGRCCTIANGVYIDKEVTVGDRVNIHNKACIYRPTVIEDDVFVGPHVCFTNDKSPRSNRIKNLRDTHILVKSGASIGCNSTIMPNITIGKHAMVGAASLVTKSVPDYGLVYGSPSKLRGFVCTCGEKLEKVEEMQDFVIMECKLCHEKIKIPKKDYEMLEV
jgi:acetyltransferase-like isoleucine patch superfamily enzyme